MFPIILVFILKESVDRSDNPTSRQNMNSGIVCPSAQVLAHTELASTRTDLHYHNILGHTMFMQDTFMRDECHYLVISSVQ